MRELSTRTPHRAATKHNLSRYDDVLCFNNPVLSAFANAIWHCSSVSEVCVVLNEAVKNAPQSDEEAEKAALQAAYNSATNWKPASRSSLGLETFKVIFSDGAEQEITHTRSKVDSWAAETNNGQFPYRVVRILDAKDNIVWGQ